MSMLNKSVEYIDGNFYYEGRLGAFVGDNETDFCVWSPTADAVLLKLYKDNKDLTPLKTVPMDKYDKGVWRHTAHQSLENLYYTYEYSFDGTKTEGVDPYARAVGANGAKGYIINLDKTNPAGWDKSDYVVLNSLTDAVLYEAHVRDFSSDQSSGVPEKNRGKYSAFTLKDTKSPSGKPTCLAHLKKLGITHVHLLPVFDYTRLDEEHPEESYNWGYDPDNYNAPEGSYSSEPCNPVSRIKELKELVMSLHESGIGVVMDVVYNHTYKCEASNLGKSFPGYYYRYLNGVPSNGSGCGNELASERAMVRRYIVDSCLYWAKEYKIDGFRFDLMACLDIDTMNEISTKLKAINPSAIIYGEGWTGGASALPYERSACKNNSVSTPNIAYFNDNYRDAIKGATFADAELGYISGNFHLRQTIIEGLLGAQRWAPNPSQQINYCEAHDNLTLWDKLIVSASGCHERDRKKMSMLAAALVILAQGVPFIHAGQEFLRSKPLGDSRYDHNSYSSPDSVNSLKWVSLDKNSDVVEYYKGLIAFRKSHPLLRISERDEVMRSNEVIPSPDGTVFLKLFGYGEELLLLVNPIPRAKVFVLPDGEWQLYISDTKASSEPMATYCEGVFVPPISVMVLKKL